MTDGNQDSNSPDMSPDAQMGRFNAGTWRGKPNQDTVQNEVIQSPASPLAAEPKPPTDKEQFAQQFEEKVPGGSISREPTQEEIQLAAYLDWVNDGKPPGNDGKSYYYNAQNRLRAERNLTKMEEKIKPEATTAINPQEIIEKAAGEINSAENKPAAGTAPADKTAKDETKKTAEELREKDLKLWIDKAGDLLLKAADSLGGNPPRPGEGHQYNLNDEDIAYKAFDKIGDYIEKGAMNTEKTIRKLAGLIKGIGKRHVVWTEEILKQTETLAETPETAPAPVSTEPLNNIIQAEAAAETQQPVVEKTVTPPASAEEQEKRRKENSLNFVKAQLKMKDDEGGKVHLFRDVGVEEFLKDNGVLQEEITKMTDDQAWAKAREFVGTMSTQTKKEEGLPTP